MRVARVVLVAALWLGACNGGSGKTDDTLPPRSSSTDTTAPDYSVPAVIDVAYVEKVMAALDHVYGDAIRTLARERKITEEFLEHLLAIYGDRFYRLAQDAWTKELSGGVSTLRATPGNPRTLISELIRADRECIVTAVQRDFGALRDGPPQSTPQRFVGLVPAQQERDIHNVNPTPWLMAYDGWTSTGEAPPDPCVS